MSIRRCSPATIKSRQSALAVFFGYLASLNIIDVREVSRQTIKDYQAGLLARHPPHVWRHTCATHMIKNDANLRHVQDLLGHGSLATTERYLRLTIADAKNPRKGACSPEQKGANSAP